MGTIKILGFDEDGNAQRLKIRIARFLDYDPVTESDKTNIRSTLGITGQGGLGDLLAANNLNDVASLDTTKANLEIPDVGTSPQEVPNNGMLGSMAYQSADSVSMGTVEAESLEVADQASIGATSGAIAAADDDAALVLQQSVGGVAELSRATDTDGHVVGKVNFANRNNSNTVNPGSANYPAVAGIEAQLETTDSNAHDDSGGHLVFKTKPEAGLLAERWRINSSGNLVANSTGIDFGSTNTASGVTVTGSVMSEYEVGTWTPSFATTGSGFTTPPTVDVVNARYVRVGDMVTFTCYVQTDSVDLTGAGPYLLLTGLPYAASASSGNNFSAVNVGYASSWVNAPAGGYVQSTAAFIYLTKRNSSVTGALSEMSPSDLTAGTTASQNRLMISGSYVIA